MLIFWTEIHFSQRYYRLCENLNQYIAAWRFFFMLSVDILFFFFFILYVVLCFHAFKIKIPFNHLVAIILISLRSYE